MQKRMPKIQKSFTTKFNLILIKVIKIIGKLEEQIWDVSLTKILKYFIIRN